MNKELRNFVNKNSTLFIRVPSAVPDMTEYIEQMQEELDRADSRSKVSADLRMQQRKRWIPAVCFLMVCFMLLYSIPSARAFIIHIYYVAINGGDFVSNDDTPKIIMDGFSVGEASRNDEHGVTLITYLSDDPNRYIILLKESINDAYSFTDKDELRSFSVAVLDNRTATCYADSDGIVAYIHMDDWLVTISARGLSEEEFAAMLKRMTY